MPVVGNPSCKALAERPGDASKIAAMHATHARARRKKPGNTGKSWASALQRMLSDIAANAVHASRTGRRPSYFLA
jgi:hypothetical protein